MKTKELGELVKIQTGKLDVNASVENGNYPFFTCAREISRIDKFAFEGESILVAGNGDLNVKYYDGRFNAYQRTYVLQKKDYAEVHLRFLYHFLSKYINILRDQSIGGVIKYIKLASLTEAPFPDIDLPTQKKIATILDKAHALVELDKQIIQKYDQLAQSVFLEMFGDPVTNPKGWDIQKLGDVSSELKYGSNSKSFTKSEIHNIPTLRIPNVIGNKINYTDLKYSNVEKKEFDKLKLNTGDILFVRTNGNPDYIGRSAVFNDNFECIYASYLIRCRLSNFDVLKPTFINYIINFKSYRRIIIKLAKTTAGNYNMNTVGLKSLKLISPPMKYQEKFLKNINVIEKQKEITQQSLVKNQELFQSLLQKAFKGELIKEQ